MRKILLTGAAALLMAISAHATENPDICAVVLKTPDGFLALRTKPNIVVRIGYILKVLLKIRKGGTWMDGSIASTSNPLFVQVL